jgi:hypothetical protein
VERPREFQTDDDKNQFILLYLQDEAARLFPIAEDSQELPWHGSFSLPIMELCDVFGPWDPIGEAEDNLRRLWMKHSDWITLFLLEFNAFTSVLE